MKVKVRWYYHPEETRGGNQILETKVGWAENSGCFTVISSRSCNLTLKVFGMNIKFKLLIIFKFFNGFLIPPRELSSSRATKTTTTCRQSPTSAGCCRTRNSSGSSTNNAPNNNISRPLNNSSSLPNNNNNNKNVMISSFLRNNNFSETTRVSKVFATTEQWTATTGTKKAV